MAAGRARRRAAVASLVSVDASRGGRGARAVGQRLASLARRFLAELKLEGCELSLVVVRDPEIRVLKRTWLGLDQATDVLSFPGGDSPAPGPRVLGDIVISLDTARRTARALRQPVARELALYLAHGLLHLLGLDHATREEATAMAKAERRLLDGEGLLERARAAPLKRTPSAQPPDPSRPRPRRRVRRQRDSISQQL